MENQDDNHKEDGHKNSQKRNGHCTQEQKCYNKVASYKTVDRMLYPILKDNARENRKQMTEGERVLERKVIVEVDGGYHAEALQQMMDTQRQSWLESKGYFVLRFTNEQVEFDTEAVVKEITSAL